MMTRFGTRGSRYPAFALLLAGCINSEEGGLTEDESSGFPSIVGSWSGQDGALDFDVSANCEVMSSFRATVGSSWNCGGNACSSTVTRVFNDVPLARDGNRYVFSIQDPEWTFDGALLSASEASGTATYQGSVLPPWTAGHASAIGGGVQCLTSDGSGLNVAGDWRGTWEIDFTTGSTPLPTPGEPPAPSPSGPMTLALSQSGTTLSGSGVLTGIECMWSVTFSGSLSGEGPSVRLFGEVQAGTSVLNVVGSVFDDRIGLSVVGTVPPCGSATGRFELTR